MREEYKLLLTETRASADKYIGRTSVFAALLLAAHLMKIKPGEFESFGLKIELPDIIMIRGIIAGLVITYLYFAVFSFMLAESLQEYAPGLIITRANIRRYNKRGLLPKDVKRRVKIRSFFEQSLMAPMAIIAVMFFIIAFLTSIYDLYALVKYCAYQYPPMQQFILWLADF